LVKNYIPYEVFFCFPFYLEKNIFTSWNFKNKKTQLGCCALTDFCLSEALIGIIGGKNDCDEYETPVNRGYPFID
jgi:hypothetical protein